MSPHKLLLTGGAIALVAGLAIVTPAIAAGVPLTGLVPATSIAAPGGGPGDRPDDGPGNNGRGHAYGHHKDSPDFPGNHGDASKPHHSKPDHGKRGQGTSDQAPDDGPGDNGRGHAYGHHKDSPDFPGNRGHGADEPDGD